MPKQIDQYRPCFSYAELEQLLQELSPESTLYKKIATFKFKVDVGLNSKAYTQTGPRPTMEDKLGFAAPDNSSSNGAGAGYETNIARLQKRAEIAPATISPADRFELLGAKAIAGTATAEEIEEGKKLELELYGSNMGTFD